MLFVVECPEYVSKTFQTRAQAERCVQVTERIGGCSGPHKIKEVPDAEKRSTPIHRRREDQ